MNPILASPPVTMVHDGDDKIADGLAIRTHDVSVVNSVPSPVTTVPEGPEVGVRVRVPGAPAVTANVAVADSPKFVVAVTVCTVPGTAPDATAKLPISSPPLREHEDEAKSPDGDDVRRHVVPR